MILPGLRAHKAASSYYKEFAGAPGKTTLLKIKGLSKVQASVGRAIRWFGAKLHASVSLDALSLQADHSVDNAASMLVDVEMALDAGTFGVRFDRAIERRFNESTKKARVDLFVRLAILGTIVYDLFLFADSVIVPDVIAWARFLQFCIGTPVALLAIIFIQRLWIDANQAAFTVLLVMGGCTIAIFMASRSDHVGLFPGVFMLFLLSANVAQALPFSWALAFSGIFTGATTIAVLLHPSLDPPTKTFSIVLLNSAAYYSLVGSFRINAGVRRAYLSALRESLRAQILHQSNSLLETIVNIDALTGIRNRRSFDESLDRIWWEKLDKGGIALLIVDIDFFKILNDTHGHQAGDACLRQVAQILAHGVDEIGIMARYGGEEFAAILPGVGVDVAFNVAEGLRRAIESSIIQTTDASHVRVTVSIGCAAFSPSIVSAPTDLIAAADAALYLAKRSGRNRTQVASDGQFEIGGPLAKDILSHHELVRVA